MRSDSYKRAIFWWEKMVKNGGIEEWQLGQKWSKMGKYKNEN